MGALIKPVNGTAGLFSARSGADGVIENGLDALQNAVCGIQCPACGNRFYHGLYLPDCDFVNRQAAKVGQNISFKAAPYLRRIVGRPALPLVLIPFRRDIGKCICNDGLLFLFGLLLGRARVFAV